MTLTEELSKLEEKAAKYEHMKDRYIQHAEKIGKVIELLQGLRKEIDPFVSDRRKVMRHNDGIGEMRDEFLKLIFAGTRINKSFIMKAHPDLAPHQAGYLMNLLAKTKGVEKSKNGTSVELFARHEH